METDFRIAGTFDTDLHKLIGELDVELRQRYPDDPIFGVDFSHPKVAEMTFVVAYSEGVPVGCGGIRPLEPGVAELKRFYIRKLYRGQGRAAAMLVYLEDQARQQGFGRIKLETGPAQPEAIRVYTRAGYHRIPLFGEYSGSTCSLCFEKSL